MNNPFFTSNSVPSYERDWCEENYLIEDSLSDEDKEEIEALYERGINPEEIADELGLDETEVIEWCEVLLRDSKP